MDFSLSFENYLTDRELRVVLKGRLSKYYKIGASVTQGSAHGPILWNIFFNDLLDLIPQLYAFADDCKISISGTPGSMGETLKNMKHTSENIRRWTTENTSSVYNEAQDVK